MMRCLVLAASAAVSLLAVPAVAQAAGSVTYYGNGCSDAGGTAIVPVMTVVVTNSTTGMPQPGATVTLRYVGQNGSGFWTESVPVLISGLSSANLPVPRLTQSMSTSCSLLVNPDIAVFVMPPSTANYLDRVSYTIPNTPTVLGASVFHQWGTIVFNTLGMTTLDFFVFSNGAQVQVGV